MIIEATPSDFAALLRACAPRHYHLVPDSPIAEPEVLRMLSDLAHAIGQRFAPAAWLIVEHDEVIGLCSVTRVPAQGSVDIGYGIVAARRGKGAATRAVAAVAQWARHDPRVHRLTADTAVDNHASQRVLERNGFRRSGERVDPEDGPLLCWELDVR
ncbi:GNAT family N-acetyltransferase [Xanthomonas sp. NCPPB 2654]|uniref:GNAT family N-acetyltransferase n=1 Tax=unclassified Xanthomonas TaxID=2643310 RepID=UPI0021DF9C3D|nr:MULTISPECIES: GNAT family N-acetyltransferase [unclassified Xanthomonas]MDL5364606.1 GNAT family N-acetyltransferase [Xanthomonas sp. NCPPB 2654]UYC21923.1 GNAT family N-acetyltransferase [Xanthomonas sp. CFBP 8443]